MNERKDKIMGRAQDNGSDGFSKKEIKWFEGIRDPEKENIVLVEGVFDGEREAFIASEDEEGNLTLLAVLLSPALLERTDEASEDEEARRGAGRFKP